MGKGSCTVAESLGLFHGLKLAWSLGFRKVKVDLDSTVIVKWVNGSLDSNYTSFGVVSSCKSILEYLCNFSVLNVYRECNRLADFLANLSHS